MTKTAIASPAPGDQLALKVQETVDLAIKEGRQILVSFVSPDRNSVSVVAAIGAKSPSLLIEDTLANIVRDLPNDGQRFGFLDAVSVKATTLTRDIKTGRSKDGPLK